MAPNDTEFRWDSRRDAAAVLVAEDALTDEAIAEQVGISKRTLERWKQAEPFRERVAEHTAALDAAVQRLAIAKRRKRVERLDRDWQRLQDLIEARGRALDGQVAGGETGLLSRTVKVIGTGKNQTTIEEYVFDAALLREIRATEEQAAKELGQWSEKHEHTGEVLVRKYVGISLDDV